MSNAPVFGHHVLALEDETVERKSGGWGVIIGKGGIGGKSKESNQKSKGRLKEKLWLADISDLTDHRPLILYCRMTNM